jgi:type I restriction enzyme S subunit
MIPKGWDVKPLGELVTIRSGGTPSKSRPDYWGGSVNWFTAKDLKSLTLRESELKLSELGAQSSIVVEPGTILVLTRGMGLLNDVPMGICQQRSAFNQDVKALLAHAGVHARFLLYALANTKHRISNLITTAGHGTCRLETESLLEHSLLIPEPSEQAAIAGVLSTCDAVEERVEALLTAKQRRRKALAQRLLTGKARLSGFATPWQTSKIGQLLKPVRRPVTWDDSAEYKLLSLRRRSGGAFHRETLLGSEILTKKMNVARAGDFLISKMQVVHGAMAMVPQEFDGFHVSDSYLAYTARSQEQLDMRFFDWLSRLPIMYRKAYISSYGVHIEKMTFNDGLFLGEKVTLPPTVEEQRAIVEVLEDADREIALHRAELDALKRQKRGLMQQLLIGKVRVP